LIFFALSFSIFDIPRLHFDENSISGVIAGTQVEFDLTSQTEERLHFFSQQQNKARLAIVEMHPTQGEISVCHAGKSKTPTFDSV
jgi:hypothetical protein